MATIKDVAAECGVTVTTVSRVLNNRGYISESTRQRVYEAMEKLNYQPNEVARSLSKKSTNTIGVIVPHISHPYFAEMISGIEKESDKRGYKVILCNSKGREHKEKEFIDMCRSNRVAGIILFSAGVEAQEFTDSNIPLVTIERFVEGGSASVECDNRAGGRLAAEHLIESGCTNLVHFSGVTDSMMPADDRAIGFAEVCEARGVHHEEVATTIDEYNSLEYYTLIEEYLSANKKADGIFASSDLIAAQALQVCNRLGRKVPNKIKIVGFDDTMISSLSTPQITTIHQPIDEMAKTAVTRVLSAASGKRVRKRNVLPVYLVKRETT